MDLSTPDDEHAPCCGACASIGAPVAESAESDTTTFFRYGPHETLAVRARSGATSEDFRVTKAVVVSNAGGHENPCLQGVHAKGGTAALAVTI